MQLYILISKNNMLHLFHQFLCICLFIYFLPNRDIIMTLLRYCGILFVALLIPFSYEDKRFTHH